MSVPPSQQWLAKAHEDVAVAQLILQEEFFSHSCFWAQQAIEKALKGYLIEKTNTHPRTHSLVDLLKLCQTHDPSLQQYAKECVVIDQYYTPTRYPDTVAGGGPNALPGQTEAEDAIIIAEKIVRYITSQI